MPDANNTLDSFNFRSNPYMDILGGGAGQSAPQGTPMGAGGGAMQQGGQALSQAMGGAQTAGQANPMDESATHEAAPGDMQQDATSEEENQFMKGKNPDKTKPLLSAIQALEGYIASATERDEIMTARGIVSLLTRLVSRDQESMMKQ